MITQLVAAAAGGDRPGRGAGGDWIPPPPAQVAGGDPGTLLPLPETGAPSVLPAEGLPPCAGPSARVTRCQGPRLGRATRLWPCRQLRRGAAPRRHRLIQPAPSFW